MTKINEIWKLLEKEEDVKSRLLARRYSATVLPDIFVALKRPEQLRCIALRLHSDKTYNFPGYEDFKDLSLEVIPDEKNISKQFFLILLSNQQHQDVFSTLCEDLIYGVANVKEEGKVVKELLNRLEKWKLLFDKAAHPGLSNEEQRGLFGELYFLRKWIMLTSDVAKCIQAWLGPEKSLRDFQHKNWALEVKTTQGNNHQKIHISNERQLDKTHLITLILYHLSLERLQQSGETLNELVDSVIELLNTDIIVQNQFNMKLLEGGYFNHHRNIYDHFGYQIRQEGFYEVKGDFPRIEERDVRNGVGEVKYTIVISNYSEYLIPESSVIALIN